MNKILNILIPIWKQFINRRKENGDVYGPHFENVIKAVGKNYIGKALLTLIISVTLLLQWNSLLKLGSFEGFELTIPVIITFYILMANAIEFILMIFLTFFRMQDYWFTRLIIWTDDHITSPISRELDNNAFGFIFGNIILLAAIYNHASDKLIHNWSTNLQSHKIIIVQLTYFFIASVIAPFILCWVNTLLSSFINTFKKVKS